MNLPDFLAIGHICHDKTPEGFVPGGTVAYAGLLASSLGNPTSLLTSFGPGFLFKGLFQGTCLSAINAAQTTIFENVYHQGGRTQFLHQKAANLRPADLPENLRQAETVLLGPIADEVSLDFIEVFKNAILCAGPQGWMRQWDASGKVSPKPFDNWERLAQATIISMSEDDVARDWQLIDKIAGMANILVVTQGANGAVVFERGKRRHFPAFPTRELDPTGAGDVFATAFLLTYANTGNTNEAVTFAMAAASLSVEKKGLAGIPDSGEIEKRRKKYRAMFRL